MTPLGMFLVWALLIGAVAFLLFLAGYVLGGTVEGKFWKKNADWWQNNEIIEQKSNTVVFPDTIILPFLYDNWQSNPRPREMKHVKTKSTKRTARTSSRKRPANRKRSESKS